MICIQCSRLTKSYSYNHTHPLIIFECTMCTGLVILSFEHWMQIFVIIMTSKVCILTIQLRVDLSSWPLNSTVSCLKVTDESPGPLSIIKLRDIFSAFRFLSSLIHRLFHSVKRLLFSILCSLQMNTSIINSKLASDLSSSSAPFVCNKMLTPSTYFLPNVSTKECCKLTKKYLKLYAHFCYSILIIIRLFKFHYIFALNWVIVVYCMHTTVLPTYVNYFFVFHTVVNRCI